MTITIEAQLLTAKMDTQQIINTTGAEVEVESNYCVLRMGETREKLSLGE